MPPQEFGSKRRAPYTPISCSLRWGRAGNPVPYSPHLIDSGAYPGNSALFVIDADGRNRRQRTSPPWNSGATPTSAQLGRLMVSGSCSIASTIAIRFGRAGGLDAYPLNCALPRRVARGSFPRFSHMVARRAGGHEDVEGRRKSMDRGMTVQATTPGHKRGKRPIERLGQWRD